MSPTEEHIAVRRLRAALAAALAARSRWLARLAERDRQDFEARRKGKPVHPHFEHFNEPCDPHSEDLGKRDGAVLRVSTAHVEIALSILQAFCEVVATCEGVVDSKPDGRSLRFAAPGLNGSVTVRERFERNASARSSFGTSEAPNIIGTGVLVLTVEGIGRTPLNFEGAPTDLVAKVRSGAVLVRMRARAHNSQEYRAALSARRDRERAAAEAEARVRAEEEALLAAAAAAEAANAERERAVQAEETSRRDRLLRDAQAWQQAEAIRRYVAAAAAAGADVRWCEWARQIADGIDPLRADEGS